MNDGQPRLLKLRVGELVEVRSEPEILATLDEQGAIDGMPFMPEMLEYCGRRFRVAKRADKTCNTITVMESRRLYDTVHLEDLRCNGSAHGDCQAQCYIFWKEAWLKRIEPSRVNCVPTSALGTKMRASESDRRRLNEFTRCHDPSDNSDILYRCQITDLLKASEPLPWWDVRQYVRDVCSGNVTVLDVIKSLLFFLFQKTLRVTAYRLQIRSYNWLQSCRGGAPYPYLRGNLSKTPRATLGLQPGELVKVKSYEEILDTLNERNRNRGLFFGPEMVPYCGSVRRVRARVERIVDERTGKMIKLPGECIILEGAICGSRYSERRLFCPRSIFPYWREIWLTRVEEPTKFEKKPDSSVSVQLQAKS
jgi:hypothetical protein